MSHTKTRIKICSIVSLFLAASLTISSLGGLTVFAVGPGNYNHETSIISGNGSTHIIGSGQDLSFVFEETLERFYGEGLLFVDNNSIDITEDVLINSRTKTITLA